MGRATGVFLRIFRAGRSPAQYIWLWCVCVALLLVTQPVAASELDDVLGGFDDSPPSEQSQLDDVLAGFEEQSADSQEVAAEPFFPEWLSIRGGLGLELSLNVAHEAPEAQQPDFRGLSMARTSFDLVADVKFSGWQARLGSAFFYDALYALQGRDHYSNRLLDDYESQAELTEAYLQVNLTDSLDLKVGRQVVVWGKSDNIRITDVLNPLDNRQPGMVDIKDLRLPVAMSRLDYYWGDWNVSGLIIHEPRWSKNPVWNSDFFPGTMAQPQDDPPSWSLETHQYGLAINGIFSGWDLSFYGASLLDNRGHLVRDPSNTTTVVHNRVTMAGAAVNVVRGSWLFKGEAAYWHGLEFSALAGEDRPRLDLLAGWEYSGLSETTFSFELSNRHIFDFDPRLAALPDGQQEDLVQWALRATRDMYNDRLTLTALLSSFGLVGEDGGFLRCQLEYDLTDSITLTAGGLFYQSGDYLPFRSIGDNDRLFVEYRYQF